MANAKDVFIICFALSCVGNVISDLPDKKKNPEEMMGPITFETIENRVAEMVDRRVVEMAEVRVATVVDKGVAEMVESRVTEMVDIKIAEMVETRVAELVEKRVAEIMDIRIAEMVEPRVAEVVENRVAEMVEIKVGEILETRIAEAVETKVAQGMSKLEDEITSELAFDMAEECKKINERNRDHVHQHKNFDNIVNEDLKQHLKDELMTEMNQSISSAVPRAVRDLPYLVTCGYQVYVAQLANTPHRPGKIILLGLCVVMYTLLTVQCTLQCAAQHPITILEYMIPNVLKL